MSQGGQSARTDLKGGAGWMVFGLVILVGAWRMDRFESMGASFYTAPGLVPGLFGLLLIVMGGVLALRGWRARHHADAGADAAEPLVNRRIALMLVLTLGYAAVLIGRAPFASSTALFVAVFTWAYADSPHGWRRIGAAALSGVLTAVLVVFVFEKIFLVRLP